MHNKLQKILHESRFVPNTNNLGNLLFVRLQKRIQFYARIRIASYLTIGIISGISLGIYAKYLYLDLNNSGVYSYFNLIIGEDISTLTFISKEMFYAIFESLPMMSMTLSLGLLFLVMISINGILLSLQKNTLYTVIKN